MVRCITYTMRLPENVASTLEGLSHLRSTSKAEIVRRSLAIYDYLHREIYSGWRIYLKNDKEKAEKELILEDLS